MFMGNQNKSDFLRIHFHGIKGIFSDNQALDLAFLFFIIANGVTIILSPIIVGLGSSKGKLQIKRSG